jgi:alanyl-tRNA synthetase
VRLYFEDSRLTTFEANVVGVGQYASWPSLVLDRTAFYPEAGGQMADRGKLSIDGHDLEVLDVQVSDDLVVHHRVAGDAVIAPGARALGVIDKPRRLEHMALHTAQHMLSQALLLEAVAPTVSARLGETACTIDLDRPSLREADVERAEALVNDLIDDRRAIRAFFPTSEELAGLALRRAPKVDHDIRVVEVEGFDVSPCGGTHCASTSEVGLVQVLGLERYKNKMRLTFVAGRRARAHLGRDSRSLHSIARELSTSAQDLAPTIQKLRADVGIERSRVVALTRQLGAKWGSELARDARERGDTRVVAVIPQGSVELLRALAGSITAELDGVAILAGSDADGQPLVISRSASQALDCGALLREVVARGGGRGGGRPEHAEGRLPAVADLHALLTAT